MPELLLLAASEVITPSSPGPLAGYAARKGLSEGTHDDLEANLVVLSQGSAATAWLAIDIVAVTEELSNLLADVVRFELEMPLLVVQVCASHTHSGPIGWTGSFYPGHHGDIDAHLRGELVESVRSLARRAGRKQPTPVYAEWSSSDLAGVAANRVVTGRNLAPSLGVLALRARDDDSLRAVVFDFANHPTTLDATNRLWSGDWPAAARAVASAGYLAARTFGHGQKRADSPTLVFLQGAAGDISTRFVRRSSGFVETARIGAVVGLRMLELLEQGGRRLSSELKVLESNLVLPTRTFPSPIESEEIICDAQRIAEKSGDASPTERLAITRVQGAEVLRALSLAPPKSSVSIALTAVSFGDLIWLHSPLELFSSLATKLVANSAPRNIRFVGYCNGYAGYLPDAEAYETESYEALSSMFGAPSGELYIDGILTLISDLSVTTEE